jgi:hypothetical protein
VLRRLALHHLTPPPPQFWTHASVTSTIVDAVFFSANYVVQLATVVPAELHGFIEATRVVEQTPHAMFGGFDALGYAAIGLE